MKRIVCLVLLLVALVAFGTVLPTPNAAATEVKSFRLQSQSAFLAGTPEKISIDPLGRLRLADEAVRIAGVEEPYSFAAAVHPRGWVIATGETGKVLLVTAGGDVETLFEAPEAQVFALWVDPDGVVFAGTAPRGKVYRIPPVLASSGSEPADEGVVVEPFFDPGAEYIWAILRDSSGRLLVGTGTEGKLFAVDAQGHGEVLVDVDDPHVRSLAVDGADGLWIGTAGEGLILRRSPAGELRTLHDATAPEVVAFAVGPDAVYAAVLASEASRVDLSASAKKEAGAKTEGEAPKANGEVSVATGAIDAGSRKAAYSGARSEILRIDASGLVEDLWSFEKETVAALVVHPTSEASGSGATDPGRLWVATGLEGKLFSWDGEQMILEQDMDEDQIVSLMSTPQGLVLATQDGVAVYRVGGGRGGAGSAASAKKQGKASKAASLARSGSYTSDVLDAGASARFGTLAWTGVLAPGTGLEMSLRSGNSATPDKTWSEWGPSTEATLGPSGLGGEISALGAPPARYAQWRAVFRGTGSATPRLDAVQLSFRQQNTKPVITSLAVGEPGEIQVPPSFNPQNQVFEPFSPNRDGIFVTLGTTKDKEGRSKTLWKKGWRTLRWSVADPNGDSLRYELAFRREGEAEISTAGEKVNQVEALTIVKDLEADFYSFDSTVLPDGVYRFRLGVDDGESNTADETLRVEKWSEPAVVDHTPPTAKTLRAGGKPKAGAKRGWSFEVLDAWNPLRQVEVSVDAGPWRSLVPRDGLLDGRREAFEVEVPAGSRLVLLRVMDASYNDAIIDLSHDLSSSSAP